MKPLLLISDRKGRIHNHRSLAATGMKGGIILPLHPSELIKLPKGSRLFMMPGRSPVGLDQEHFELIPRSVEHFAVAAFLPPGYTVTYSPGYAEIGHPKPLPLFSYAACASYKGALYAAAARIDPEPRHDAARISLARVKKGIAKLRKLYPANRLIRHLETCALSYGCCGAQNFFLEEYECPLPASPSCNASCAGCISYQSTKAFPPAQPRIRFVPAPEELAEAALHHIRRVADPVVSFGQGCEGEPLLEGEVIERAIRLIRAVTRRGVINMNTNASKPGVIARLAEAGLDSIRVSMNSAREEFYTRYYRPRGYAFRDVLRSIGIMKNKKRFVSLNYLTIPGFTDTPGEYAALRRIIRRYAIDMVQWRNLNYDPLLYFKVLKIRRPDIFIGIRREIDLLKEEFPELMHGYFNPTRRKMGRRQRWTLK